MYSLNFQMPVSRNIRQFPSEILLMNSLIHEKQIKSYILFEPYAEVI